MTITLFDPSIASANLGDEIILDAVRRELRNLFPGEQLMTVPTQEVISGISIRHANQARHRIVGGTNLLSSSMLHYKQWQVNLLQALRLRDVTLMGVGWWQYQKEPDLYTRTVLRNLLSRKKLHSVRDEYTRSKLASIGLTNVLNTGCPTMWQLTPEHCEGISRQKSPQVVLTLTDYHKDVANDLKLIELLCQRYEKVHFWPQGSGDLAYVRQLNVPALHIIKPSLAAYDELLATEAAIDFVGTRLHGGVRAMQFKRRALIIAVDNRAREISADTGLPVVGRDDLNAVKQWIEHPAPTVIRMNQTAIGLWKQQFEKEPVAAL